MLERFVDLEIKISPQQCCNSRDHNVDAIRKTGLNRSKNQSSNEAINFSHPKEKLHQQYKLLSFVVDRGSL